MDQFPKEPKKIVERIQRYESALRKDSRGLAPLKMALENVIYSVHFI